MEDKRGPYFRALQASDLPHQHWSGPSPEDADEMWYFETVIDGGKYVAIRQLTVESDGTRHAYSAHHLEDDWGFLTDQPVDPEASEGLVAITPSEFESVWRSI